MKLPSRKEVYCRCFINHMMTHFLDLALGCGRGFRTALDEDVSDGKNAMRERDKEFVPNGLIKHALQVALRQCRALQVLVGLDLLGHLQRLLVRDGGHLLRTEGLVGCRVILQIELGTHQDDRHAGRVVLDLRVPFRLDVVEGRRADDGEADQEHIGLRVGQRAQAVVVLLAGGIPEPEADRATINHHTGGVVVEPGETESTDVLFGEGAGSEVEVWKLTPWGCIRPGRHWWCMRSAGMSISIPCGQSSASFSIHNSWGNPPTLPTAPSPVTTHCPPLTHISHPEPLRRNDGLDRTLSDCVGGPEAILSVIDGTGYPDSAQVS